MAGEGNELDEKCGPNVGNREGWKVECNNVTVGERFHQIIPRSLLHDGYGKQNRTSHKPCAKTQS